MNPQQIVDASQAQKKYPILMKHPQHSKATISGYKRNPDGSATDDPPGIPGRFEDHWVSNIDQEQYYASMGYAPQGTADIETYRRELCGIDPAPVDHDYPCALYRLKPDGEMDTAVAETKAKHQALEKDGWRTTQAEAKASSAKKVVSLASDKPKTETKPAAAEKPAAKAKPKKRVAKPMSQETKDKIRASMLAKAAAKKAKA